MEVLPVTLCSFSKCVCELSELLGDISKGRRLHNMLLQQAAPSVMLRTLRGQRWRQLLLPHLLLLSLPCPRTSCVWALGGQSRALHKGMWESSWSPSAQFSLPAYFSHGYIQKCLWKQLILIPLPFFFFFFHDHDFVNKFIHPSHLALGFIRMQPGSTNRSLSAVLAARPDAPNELFAGKLQTCNYTQKLFSK